MKDTSACSKSFSVTCRDGRYGFVDSSGHVVVPFIYDCCLAFHEGRAAVCSKGWWGYVDQSGNEVIPCQFTWAGDFMSGRASVRKDGQFYFIDPDGRTILGTSGEQVDFRSMKLRNVSELDEFISYDRDRYMSFLGDLNRTLEHLPAGSVLKAVDYVKPLQYRIFVKVCCWLCCVSRMQTGQPYYYEMEKDCSGIRKIARKR